MLEGLLPRESALSLASALVALHTEENAAHMHHPGEEYQTLFGLLNREDRVWECAAHPAVQEVVRPLLGELQDQLAEERVGPREPRAREGSGVVLVESG